MVNISVPLEKKYVPRYLNLTEIIPLETIKSKGNLRSVRPIKDVPIHRLLQPFNDVKDDNTVGTGTDTIWYKLLYVIPVLIFIIVVVIMVIGWNKVKKNGLAKCTKVIGIVLVTIYVEENKELYPNTHWGLLTFW